MRLSFNLLQKLFFCFFKIKQFHIAFSYSSKYPSSLSLFFWKFIKFLNSLFTFEHDT